MNPRDTNEQVSEYWSASSPTWFGAASYWLAHPVVAARYQSRIVQPGADKHWVNHTVNSFLRPRGAKRVLSIGCGRGDLERHLLAVDPSLEIEAIDCASDSVEAARAAAREGGLNIEYRVGDAESADYEGQYDATFFDASLHHMFDVGAMLDRVSDLSKPGALIILNEYIGPNFFSLSTRELELHQAAFSLLPPQLRRDCIAREPFIRSEPAIPTPAEVRADDPSEGVFAEQIMPDFLERFDVLQSSDPGGSLLHFCLNQVVGNFTPQAPMAVESLQMLFEIEDWLVESGQLRQQFVYAVGCVR